MILDVGAHSRSNPDFAISFQGVLSRARLFKSSNRFTAYSSYSIELKLDRMIPDINPHNRWKLDFFDFLTGCAVGLRPFKSLNRFTAYSIHPIRLKLSRMIPTRQQSAQSCGFFDFFTGSAVGDAPLEIFQLDHSSQFLCN